MPNKIDPKSESTQKKLKIIGVPFLVIGVICVVVAFVDFFVSISSTNAPSLFFLFFIGFPCIFVGGSSLMFANTGKISRYNASQVAPVAKDTINYVFDEQLHKGKIKCPKCENYNDKDAKFCDECGAPLITTCRYCGVENDGDAKHCKNCGKEIC